MLITEYFNRIVEDNHCIEWIYNDDFVTSLTFEKDILTQEIFEKVISAVDVSKDKICFWETILPYLSEKVMYDSCFHYFVANQIGLIILAHMPLDNQKLKILSKYVQEALFTLMKRYYTLDEYSEKIFCEELNRYLDDDLLEQLLLLKPSSEMKEAILLFSYEKSNSSNVVRKVQKIQHSKIVKVSSDIQLLTEAFLSGDDLDYLSLSCNLHTPLNILEQLAHVKNVKNSSYIRKNSLQTMQIKKMIDREI